MEYGMEVDGDGKRVSLVGGTIIYGVEISER